MSPLDAVFMVMMLIVTPEHSYQHVVFSTPDLQECKNTAQFLEHTVVLDDKERNAHAVFMCSQGFIP